MVGAYISVVVNQGAEQSIRRRFDRLARAQLDNQHGEILP